MFVTFNSTRIWFQLHMVNFPIISRYLTRLLIGKYKRRTILLSNPRRSILERARHLINSTTNGVKISPKQRRARIAAATDQRPSTGSRHLNLEIQIAGKWNWSKDCHAHLLNCFPRPMFFLIISHDKSCGEFPFFAINLLYWAPTKGVSAKLDRKIANQSIGNRLACTKTETIDDFVTERNHEM